MEYQRISAALAELGLRDYQKTFEDNALTDMVLLTFISDGKLVEYLKEVIPPLRHRPALLSKFNDVLRSQEEQELESGTFVTTTGKVNVDLNNLLDVTSQEEIRVICTGSQYTLAFNEFFVVVAQKIIKCST